MGISLLLQLFAVYTGISVVIGVGGIALCKKYGILDKPGPDVPKRERVPTLQGVFMIVAAGLGLIVTKYYLGFSFGVEFFALFVGGVLIGIVSGIDELGRIIHPRYRVSSMMRLALQVLIASFAWYISGVQISEIAVIGYELPTVISRLFTVFWFVLFTNSINWFDGVYGLASGSSAIGFLSIVILIHLIVFGLFPDMSIERQWLLTKVEYISLLLFTVCLVSTCIEYKPSGLMRDVGTMFFGFCLGYLSLLGGAKIGTILVVLSLPLFDAFWVIIERIRRGKNPLSGDGTHLHYRLLRLGWNRHEVRFFVRIWSLFLMVIMLLLGGDKIGKIIIFGCMFSLFFGVHIYLYWIKKLPYEYTSSVLEKTKKNN